MKQKVKPGLSHGKARSQWKRLNVAFVMSCLISRDSSQSCIEKWTYFIIKWLNITHKQHTSHSVPSWVSYGVSIVSIVENDNHVIIRQHSILLHFIVMWFGSIMVQNTISLSSLCKLIWRHCTYKMSVRYILLSVWVRLSIFSPLSIIQYVGLYVFSLPISLMMIEIIYIYFVLLSSSNWK